ncbi:leucine--tRNA ligase [Candidatus Kaiserbacteria bacterium]|nr:MAG: leucine--tRNA ligase [Candidatus Kaiserbacteria bacterium]
MHKKFNHEEIEQKWQKSWKESGIYNLGARDTNKEKEYVLVEWPYPSGNLHVGHWFAFAVVDIYVRARRMQGKQVLFPIGFDAFGLPAENAAIKNKLDPKAWTESNIAYMKKQLESMGNAFSWDVSVSSTDPEYFKMTQWMFTQFFEKGIAYRGKGVVNWCPACNTVIANEQVTSSNTCERCGNTIIKKDMTQWMLKITDYADRLIDDLDTLAWPEPIKEAQRQWIGRSKGAKIPFTLSTGDTLDIFTTRPDTLYGATYVVLAPEHDLVLKNKEVIQNWAEVEAYIKEASQKDEMLRTKVEKEKTGVCLTGITTTNPATGKSIPVFIADYVLKGYGTGAIMAVPAHDERDFAFAKKFTLPIVQVIKGNEELPFTLSDTLINSGEFTGMDSEEAKGAITLKVGGELTNTYRLRDWSIGRQRYWGVPIPIVYDKEGTPHPIPKEHLPWHLPTDVDFTPTGEPPLAKSVELRERVTRIFGEGWTPEVETMDTFVDSSWYFLRYLDTQNAEVPASLEAQKTWMPVDVYFGGSEHTTMHVLYSRFWQKALFDLDLVTSPEPYKMRINRGLVLGPDGNKMSKSKGNVVDPDEQVKILGADTVKMYLAFMGPYGELANYPWDMGGIAGLRRFLERVYGLAEHVRETESHETTSLLHKTIEKVSADIAVYKFNTAISALMIFINHAEKLGLTKNSYLLFLRLLAPFAPHITEELWYEAGNSGSIHMSNWPASNPTYLIESSVTLSVQINGKMRGTIIIPIDSAESEVLAVLKADETLASKLPANITRVVYIQNKIINLIGEA